MTIFPNAWQKGVRWEIFPTFFLELPTFSGRFILFPIFFPTFFWIKHAVLIVVFAIRNHFIRKSLQKIWMIILWLFCQRIILLRKQWRNLNDHSIIVLPQGILSLRNTAKACRKIEWLFYHCFATRNQSIRKILRKIWMIILLSKSCREFDKNNFILFCHKESFSTILFHKT